MADLNAALHSCRCGGYVRDDANMAPEWKIQFVPEDTKEARRLPRHKRAGKFQYINPQGEPAHDVRFSDAMKASWQWRVVL